MIIVVLICIFCRLNQHIESDNDRITLFSEKIQKHEETIRLLNDKIDIETTDKARFMNSLKLTQEFCDNSRARKRELENEITVLKSDNEKLIEEKDILNDTIHKLKRSQSEIINLANELIKIVE